MTAKDLNNKQQELSYKTDNEKDPITDIPKEILQKQPEILNQNMTFLKDFIRQTIFVPNPKREINFPSLKGNGSTNPQNLSGNINQQIHMKKM